MEDDKIELNDIANELLIINKYTIENLFKLDNCADCIALYIFYYKTAKWQKTNQIYAKDSYVRKVLKWGTDRIRNTKKTLKEKGLIDIIQRRANGKIAGWYIKVNYLVSERKLENVKPLIQEDLSNNYSNLLVEETNSSFPKTNTLKENNKYFKNKNIDILYSENEFDLENDLKNIKPKTFSNKHIEELENGKQKKKKQKKNYNVQEILNRKKVNLKDIESIITYLNEKTNKKYKVTTKVTQDLISNWMKQDFTVEQFKDVIDKKVKEWQGTEMEQYLRPSTLFGDKFEEYYNTPLKMQGKLRTSFSSKPTFDNCADHDTSNNPKFNKMSKEEIEQWELENCALDEDGNPIEY